VLGCLPVGGLVALSMRGSHADIGTVTARAGLLLVYATLMVGVCALACIGPTLRALRVEPTEALNDYRLKGGRLRARLKVAPRAVLQLER
jgi:hypothetical protein